MKPNVREANHGSSSKFEQASRWKYAFFFSGHVQGFRLGNATTNAKARCPFHDDDDLSLSVNIDTGHWKCRACGVKGDCKRRGISLPTFKFRSETGSQKRVAK
jgi:CHC2 zinc finger